MLTSASSFRICPVFVLKRKPTANPSLPGRDSFGAQLFPRYFPQERPATSNYRRENNRRATPVINSHRIPVLAARAAIVSREIAHGSLHFCT